MTTESGEIPRDPETTVAPLRRLRLVLQYDGTDYCGWQRQADVRSIQQVVEDTLATIVGERPILHASGRTDAGVHALGQVAHFDTGSRIEPRAVKNALNARLPHDIAVAAADEVAPDFHSRFSVRRKTYCYQFHLGDFESPFLRRHYLHVWREPSIERMREAALALVGTHDFRAFAAETKEREDTTRTIFALRVRRIAPGIRVYASGSGFLMHMVRTIAGTLLKVGHGRLTVDDVVAIRDSKDRRRAPAALPARGLFLWRVDY